MKYFKLLFQQTVANVSIRSSIPRTTLKARLMSTSSSSSSSFSTSSSTSSTTTKKQNVTTGGGGSDDVRSDMEQLFLDRRVRYLLKRLTGYNPYKVFVTKSLDNLQSPKYRFMTDEQLRIEKEIADQKAEQYLQMPPVKYAQDYQPEVLVQDAALQGLLNPSVKLIFMDASPGFSDAERLIVVREADGTLREATRDERHRTNQIFYPVEERLIDMPKMFEEPHTEEVLNRGSYKLLLDNACLHLEPEDSRYIELCHKTYEHIASKHTFDSLLSTRHYGGMVYYFVYNRRMDPLLYHLLTTTTTVETPTVAIAQQPRVVSPRRRLNEALNLLQLYYIVNPNSSVESLLPSLPESLDLTMSQLADLTLGSTANVTEDDHKNKQELIAQLEQLVPLLKFYLEHDSSQSSTKPRLQLVAQKLDQELRDELEDQQDEVSTLNSN